MEEMLMLSRSIYIRINPRDICKLMNENFNVKKENCLHFKDYTDFTFHSRQESAFRYDFVQGDFSVAGDIDLYGFTEKEFIDKLLALSKGGYVFAIPDEESPNPFQELLIEDGKSEMVSIISDDNTDTITILYRD